MSGNRCDFSVEKILFFELTLHKIWLTSKSIRQCACFLLYDTYMFIYVHVVDFNREFGVSCGFGVLGSLPS